MRQKVAVACALLHEPVVMLLDEPLTGLDRRGIRTLYDALEERSREGAAVLLSTHLLGQIENLCTKFLILREGRLTLLRLEERDSRRVAVSPGGCVSRGDLFPGDGR